MYLVFNTLEQATTANNIISQNMGLSGDIRVKWAEPVETQENKFAFIKPDNVYMSNVETFDEQENITALSLY